MVRDRLQKLRCSFCGKSEDKVKKLVAGPGVFICDQCVALCNQIIADEPPRPDCSQPGGWVSRSIRRVFGMWLRRFRTVTAPAS